MSAMKEHAIENHLGPFSMTEAEIEHANAVIHYEKAITDGAAALIANGGLEWLALNEPAEYERLRNRILSFEAEMLNEEPDHAS